MSAANLAATPSPTQGQQTNARKKQRFTFNKRTLEQPEKKLKSLAPKVCELEFGYCSQSSPPDNVRKLLADAKCFFAFDVETHKLVPTTTATILKNGQKANLYSRVASQDLSALRVVQIGWAVGRVDDAHEPVVKAYVVKPEGYTIDEEATAKHRITQEAAASGGAPLKDVLAMFLCEAKAASEQGARMTSFNLAFDAAMIRFELARAGFNKDIHTWDNMIGDGLCTMHPHICRWVTEMAGKTPLDHSSLQLAVRTLMPEHVGLLDNHHDAGVDARLHLLLCKALAVRTE